MNRLILLVIFLAFLALPLWVSDFWLTQVIGRALILGIAALSLTFLSTYLGVVSFAQITLAGVAGYAVAFFSLNTSGIGIELPWAVTILVALTLATVAGALIGAIAKQSVGIYSIMITLAVSMAFFYFTRQNYSIFNGWTGFSGIKAPIFLGFDFNQATTFYYLCIAVALFAIGSVLKFVTSPLGLTIQGVRDAARRVRSVGIPTAPVIISAYAFSGFIAGLSGILNVWHQERISSFSVGLAPTIDVLIIAVIGGMRHPVGAFIGAITFVLIDTYAIDLISRDRFNTVIGLVLLIIVIAAPEGILGSLNTAKARIKKLHTHK